MQGVLSLAIFYLIGVTYASIAVEDGIETIEEKPSYYPRAQTFGRPRDPAYQRVQAPAFGRPQVSAYNQPQVPNYNRLQAPEYDQPQASAYTRPQAYNRVQAPEYDQTQTAAYDQSLARQQYLANYVKLQQAQEAAYYKQLQEQRAAAQRAPVPPPAREPAPTPAPTLPPTKPTPRTSCPGNCPKWCVPRCDVTCCNPKPPPMPEYLQRQQLTASACEGHKLKITCPNRSDKIIMYSTFYGREHNDNSTCHHDVLPSKGTCNDQEHHVNEKVFNLCGHERRCVVAVNNKFLAKDNTTICPGVYKYLKVIYKCSQHPKIFKICPLPCKNTKKCFPSCDKNCCSPSPPKPKPIAPTPPPSCPAPCPSTCKPPCTPQCCYSTIAREDLKPYFGIKPKPHPKPQPPPALPNMYAQQASPQSNYYASLYQGYQAAQNPLTRYSTYGQQSSCPAGCKRTCATWCPQECCLERPQSQYGGQAVNYYG